MTSDVAITRWLIVGLAAVGIYALRCSFIILWDRVDEVPARVTYALSLVPPAVLATFIVPGVLAPSGNLSLSLDNARLVAAPVAIVVAYRTESILWTLASGVGVLLVWQTVVL